MKKSDFTLVSVRRLCTDVYELVLSGDASDITAPGQFVHIALPGHFLRRPVSVCGWTADRLTLLVKEAGSGTRDLVRMAPGTRLDLLTGLGNGFDLSVLPLSGTGTEGGVPLSGAGTEGGVPESCVILAGGGIGIAPLYGLACKMRDRGMVPAAALGFRSAADAFYLDEFAALGCKLSVALEQGSLSGEPGTLSVRDGTPSGKDGTLSAGEGIPAVRGFVTDLLSAVPERDYVFCCGPSPMLKAVHALPHITGGQFSFEARMACGFGACMGCSIVTKHGMRRVCQDGPVFRREEIAW